jgi:sarcosine oxidase subunit delta
LNFSQSSHFQYLIPIVDFLSILVKEEYMSLTITCPICGKRNGYEFRFGGEEKGPRPDEAGLTPAAWSDYVHMNQSVAGIQQEWWFHRDGCGSWFTIYRNTTTNLEVDQSEAPS